MPMPAWTPILLFMLPLWLGWQACTPPHPAFYWLRWGLEDFLPMLAPDLHFPNSGDYRYELLCLAPILTSDFLNYLSLILFYITDPLVCINLVFQEDCQFFVSRSHPFKLLCITLLPSVLGIEEGLSATHL
jgi:hypothetical protein